MSKFFRSGTIVDIVNRRMFPGTVFIENGKITVIQEDLEPKGSHFILPGFIDAHIHIESSMLIPSEFARLASVHGTVATVSDPHEIANVLGIDGIRYMIQNGNLVPFHFYFGASSCVPATNFETAGATLDSQAIEELFKVDRLKYLSEMMNYPGVLHRDSEVMKKIAVAKKFNIPIDGHAPGLMGAEAEKYIAAGISTDHECFTLEEALDKIKYGMKIIIREGSAAKNFEALHPLIKMHPDLVMFCSDDKHPHELVEGHINQLVKRAITDCGYDLMDVLRAATLNPINHYRLEVGLLQVNDSADFIVVEDLKEFKVLETYSAGELIALKGKSLIAKVESTTPNFFNTKPKDPNDFKVPATHDKIHVIHPENGQLITHDHIVQAKIKDHLLQVDVEHDILKLTVINRYESVPPAIAFIKNFGLKTGAIASSIAHDCHNVIAVGCSDEDLCNAANLVIKNKGGIAVVKGTEQYILSLPVAGLMTNEDGYTVAEQYVKMDKLAKLLGSKLDAPFMTLSFMALLVIPELKLSDKGLFDGKKFHFIPLEV